MPNEENSTELEVSSSRVILGVVIALVVLGGLTYAAYLYSNRQGGLILPSGYQKPGAKPILMADMKCDNPDPAYKNTPSFYIKCEPYKSSLSTKWVTKRDTAYGVKLDIPSDLPTVTYPNGIGFTWKTLKSNTNLFISYEPAAARSGNFKTMTGEEYPKNYWKQYGGLTGLKSLVEYKNKAGLKGWQAVYFYGPDTPTIDTFFEDPKAPGDFVHLSKGVLADDVYNTILDSFGWIPKATPSPSPTASASASPEASL